MDYLENKDYIFETTPKQVMEVQVPKNDYASLQQNVSVDNNNFDQYKNHKVKRRTLIYKFNDVA